MKRAESSDDFFCAPLQPLQHVLASAPRGVTRHQWGWQALGLNTSNTLMIVFRVPIFCEYDQENVPLYVQHAWYYVACIECNWHLYSVKRSTAVVAVRRESKFAGREARGCNAQCSEAAMPYSRTVVCIWIVGLLKLFVLNDFQFFFACHRSSK